MFSVYFHKKGRTMRAVFLDRDGVINIEKEYLHTVEAFEFIDGVFDACRHFQHLGYKLVIVTNQSGIGRGFYTEDDFETLTLWMLEQFRRHGVLIDAVYHCPHTPDTACSCRKPNPGMMLQAAQEHNIDLSDSWMIGDKESDIEAALAAGIGHTILVRSGHAINEKESRADYLLDSIKESIDIIKS